jgi:hypothetical protein
MSGVDLYAAELPGVCIFDSNLVGVDLSGDISGRWA